MIAAKWCLLEILGRAKNKFGGSCMPRWTVAIGLRAVSGGNTSGCDVIEVVWLSSHHDLITDDGVAVDVCTLSTATWRIVLT